MADKSILCPGCSYSVPLDGPRPEGQRLRCPGCKQALVIPAKRAPQPVHAPSRTPPPAHPENEAPPNGPALIVAPPRPGDWGYVWLAVVGGGLLLVLGAGVAGALYFSRRPPVVAKKPAPRPLEQTHQAPQKEVPAPIKPVAPVVVVRGPVEEAIHKGVVHLKTSQLPGGSWSSTDFEAGLAALPALTLLECGEPVSAPHVSKAVAFVRAAAPKLEKTYEISLAILLLDRAGGRENERLIRKLALRLVAGQTHAGGWSYECPVLPESQEDNLLLALGGTRRAAAAELSRALPSPRDLSMALVKPAGADTSSTLARGTREPPLTRAAPPAPTEQQQRALQSLPPSLQAIPSFRPQNAPLRGGDPGDNSNTQFAALALWTARRRGVPVERALTLLARRFRSSQKATGGWGYLFYTADEARTLWDTTTPSMTGAGLLGLAVSHGLASTSGPVRDPGVTRGLKAIAHGMLVKPDPLDLYFLWTVERVGVLYGLRTIEGKDWYAWGKGLVLPRQQPSGAWYTHGYRGASNITDTCFALLFLRRANLTPDLTRHVVQQFSRVK